MEETKPKPKGRGAIIAAALKKAEEAKAAAQEEAPRSRGRAALLEQLRKKNVPRVGESSSQPQVQEAPKPSSSSVKEQKPSSSVKEVTEQFKDLDIDKPEAPPCEYKGESGSVVPASANYILLKMMPDRGVFEYEVRFQPDVDSKSARVKMLNKCIPECKAKTFDGKVLYLPNKIVETRQDFECQHPFSDETIVCSIIYKKQKRMVDCLHLYNVLFKRIMFILQYKRVGRQFFDNRNPFLVPQHKLEIWPGYVVSVNEFSGGIMLCLDVQHRVLRTQNALEFIYECVQTNQHRYKPIIEKAFLGAVVLTRYNNKTYVIHDVSWDTTPETKFETSSGGSISFIEYYKKQYNLNITDRDQPMLVHRQTVTEQGKTEKVDRIIMLVPELCFLTGLTDEMRADFRVMKDVAQYTRVTPNQRMNSLRKFTSSVNEIEEAREVLSAWGLRLDSATIDLQMRILQAEDILFGNDVSVHGTPQADWTSAAMKNKVLTAVDFRNWIIIHTGQDKRTVEEFVQSIQRLGPRMGIRINPPRLVCISDDRNETYIKILQQNIVDGLQIVVIVCPTSRDDRYMTIKKICVARTPVPSQVINSRTIKNPKKLSAISQKIALQMNCKLGGSLWSVRFPFKKWMICGVDVFHSKGMNVKAVAGFVSSLNESMTKWYSRCSFHDNDKEIGDHLKVMFYKALQEFHSNNSFYPAQIVIFRDGVGDGQLETVKNFEVPQLLSVIEDLGLPIKLTYIIVQKRISARIFAMNRSGEDNPIPGSIVDDGITRKYLYDFFLVAQQVRQGTVTPTHYITLYDSGNIKPDYVQRLTYKMCHMYYNWTGTVRVPAPCQYAHKLAYLIGQNVRAEHSSKLAHTLFYL